MAGEHPYGRSKRNKRLAEKFANKRFRDSYVSANVRRFLAMQMRALRGDLSQAEFGKKLGIPQSVVSRYEDPTYGKFALQTLLEIAAKSDRALVTRFVDFPTFIRFTEDLSPKAMCPDGYDQNAVDRLSLGLQAVPPQFNTPPVSTDSNEATIPLADEAEPAAEFGINVGGLWRKTESVGSSQSSTGYSQPILLPSV